MTRRTFEVRRIALLGLALLLSYGATAPVESALAASGSGDSALFSLNTQFLSPVDQDPGLPAANSLGAGYPNPFNPATTIAFSLAEPEAVDLAVYDLTGRLVRVLLAGESMTAGEHAAVWTGRDDRGRDLAAGVYLVRLKAGDFSAVRRLTLIK